MSGHTPGPWEVCGHDIRGPYSMGDSERPGLHICTVAGGDRANARLIAAAPELLEALEILMDDLGALTNKTELFNRLNDTDAEKVYAAYAKATGAAQ